MEARVTDTAIVKNLTRAWGGNARRRGPIATIRVRVSARCLRATLPQIARAGGVSIMCAVGRMRALTPRPLDSGVQLITNVPALGRGQHGSARRKANAPKKVVQVARARPMRSVPGGDWCALVARVFQIADPRQQCVQSASGRY